MIPPLWSYIFPPTARIALTRKNGEPTKAGKTSRPFFGREVFSGGLRGYHPAIHRRRVYCRIHAQAAGARAGDGGAWAGAVAIPLDQQSADRVADVLIIPAPHR